MCLERMHVQVEADCDLFVEQLPCINHLTGVYRRQAPETGSISLRCNSTLLVSSMCGLVDRHSGHLANLFTHDEKGGAAKNLGLPVGEICGRIVVLRCQ